MASGNLLIAKHTLSNSYLIKCDISGGFGIEYDPFKPWRQWTAEVAWESSNDIRINVGRASQLAHRETRCGLSVFRGKDKNGNYDCFFAASEEPSRLTDFAGTVWTAFSKKKGDDGCHIRQMVKFPEKAEPDEQPQPGSSKNIFVREMPSAERPGILRLEQWAFEGAYSPDFSPSSKREHVFYPNALRILFENEETLLVPLVTFPDMP
ncbi:MAG: hypothetical protein LBT59_06185 [Clostridiales bacterium]|jgi:hypothetical protein|nr:hypothetical protein [Clostridiales bacterium]